MLAAASPHPCLDKLASHRWRTAKTAPVAPSTTTKTTTPAKMPSQIASTPAVFSRNELSSGVGAAVMTMLGCVGAVVVCAAVGVGDGSGGFEMWTLPRAAGVTPLQCCSNVASKLCTYPS